MKFNLPEYAANRKNTSAIVYPSQSGPGVILTRADFKTEQEFMFWKTASDEIFCGWETAERREKSNTISLASLPESAAALPGVEQEMMAQLDTLEDAQRRRLFVSRLRSILTETQHRRFTIYVLEHRTAREISDREGVSISAVAKSIRQAIRKLAAFSVR